MVVLTAENLFSKRSRAFASFVTEAQDLMEHSTIERCADCLLDAYTYYVFFCLRRVGAIKANVEYVFRGLEPRRGSRAFHLASGLDKLLKASSLISKAKPVQIHHEFVSHNIFHPDTVHGKATKVLHYAVFVTLETKFAPALICEHFVKAAIRNRVRYLGAGSKSRTFDARTNKGVKLIAVTPTDAVPPPASSRLTRPVAFATELGAAQPLLPEFTQGERRIIRSLKNRTETVHKVTKSPLLVLLLLDFVDYYDKAKPKEGFHPSVFRNSGLTKQDSQGTLHLSRRDRGLQDAYSGICKKPETHAALLKVRCLPEIRLIIHSAKCAVHRVDSDEIKDFFSRYWELQNFEITGAVWFPF